MLAYHRAEKKCGSPGPTSIHFLQGISPPFNSGDSRNVPQSIWNIYLLSLVIAKASSAGFLFVLLRHGSWGWSLRMRDAHGPQSPLSVNDMGWQPGHGPALLAENPG